MTKNNIVAQADIEAQADACAIYFKVACAIIFLRKATTWELVFDMLHSPICV